MGVPLTQIRTSGGGSRERDLAANPCRRVQQRSFDHERQCRRGSLRCRPRGRRRDRDLAKCRGGCQGPPGRNPKLPRSGEHWNVRSTVQCLSQSLWGSYRQFSNPIGNLLKINRRPEGFCQFLHERALFFETAEPFFFQANSKTCGFNNVFRDVNLLQFPDAPSPNPLFFLPGNTIFIPAFYQVIFVQPLLQIRQSFRSVQPFSFQVQSWIRQRVILSAYPAPHVVESLRLRFSPRFSKILQCSSRDFLQPVTRFSHRFTSAAFRPKAVNLQIFNESHRAM